MAAGCCNDMHRQNTRTCRVKPQLKSRPRGRNDNHHPQRWTSGGDVTLQRCHVVADMRRVVNEAHKRLTIRMGLIAPRIDDELVRYLLLVQRPALGPSDLR